MTGAAAPLRCDRLLRPASIAVVGASERPSPGRTVVEAARSLGFAGTIYPINPNYDELLGHRAYRSLEEVSGPIDLVAFCVRNDRLLESYRQAAAKRVGAAVIYAGGFGEARDEASQRLNAEIVGLSREAGIALCGPNCMGVISPANRSSAYLHEITDPATLFGNVGLISQSGSICIALLADCRRYGFSHVVSSGNEAVLSAADYLEFMIEDPETRVIATFTETIKEPERFIALLDRAADRGKPVVVLKVGKSERARRAIVTHTGGLASENRVFSAVLRAHRAIEVDDIDELCEVLAVAQGRRWPQGQRMAVVTGSGGQAELILDVCQATGIELSPLDPTDRAEVESVVGSITGDGNPLDAWGAGDFRTNYPHALDVLGRSERYDAIALCGDAADDQPLANPGNNLVYCDIVNAAAAAHDLPFYYLSTHAGVFRTDQARRLGEGGCTLVSGSRQGLMAIDRLARWNVPLGAARPPPGSRSLLAATLGRRSVHEHNAKTLLAGYGLPIAPERLVGSLPQAEEAAAEIGYPVVLKLVSDDVPHRTEHGLVEVGLATPPVLRAAWARLQDRANAIRPALRDFSFVVQAMVSGGVEVFLGVKRDRDFGLALAFGPGGVLVEVIGETTLRPLPLRQGDAEAMVAEAPIATQLLAGARGAMAADVPALCRAIESVADFAWAERDYLDELDVNPIRVLPRGAGCVALDALIIPRAGQRDT